MNLVKTYLEKSPIEGIGLFAAEFIPKGTLIWKLTEPFDLVLDKNVFDAFLFGSHAKFSDVFRNNLLRYYYEKDGKCVFCGDGARFANHSLNSNTQSFFDKQFAKTDIRKGDEITCNYSEINTEFNPSEFDILKSYK